MIESETTSLDCAVDLMNRIIQSKTPPVLPDDLATHEGLKRLISDLLEIRRFVLNIANGDMTGNLGPKGYLGGALKTLQAHLNHMTWQTQMIATGDFTQRVDFMGDFSTAFNTMVVQLEETMAQLIARKKQLSIANDALRKEIEDRKEAESKLAKANETLKRLAAMDGLTQLANRRMFDDFLLREWRRHVRLRSELTLIMCDIDFFKRYNDTYGHQAGDDCLKQVAAQLKSTAKRPGDLVARYGGEEFVFVFPDTDRAGAEHMARAIVQGVRTLKIPHTRSQVASHVTLSMGVACTMPDNSQLPETLIETADMALYEVKANGRDGFILKTCPEPYPSSLQSPSGLSHKGPLHLPGRA